MISMPLQEFAQIFNNNLDPISNTARILVILNRLSLKTSLEISNLIRYINEGEICLPSKQTNTQRWVN